MNIALYSGFMGAVKTHGLDWTLEQTVKAGCSSVEIFEDLVSDVPLGIGDREEAEELRERLKAYGLTVACYSAYANVWMKEADYERVCSRLKYSIDIAAELGSPYFHHTLLPWLTLPKEAPAFSDGIARAVEAASIAADHAKPLGVACIYEDQGQYVNGTEGFGAFYWELKKNCSNVGVCADLGNILFVNERPEPFLEAFGGEILHVHVKDYLQSSQKERPGKGWLPTRDGTWLYDMDPGKGIVDLTSCMQILKGQGYEGAYALEISSGEPFMERIAQAVNVLHAIE